MLSQFGLGYLTGKIQLDGKEAANAMFRINRKLKDCFYPELPLLESRGYLDENGRKSTSLMKILESLKETAVEVME